LRALKSERASTCSGPAKQAGIFSRVFRPDDRYRRVCGRISGFFIFPPAETD
jgi:hypothetical protein